MATPASKSKYRFYAVANGMDGSCVYTNWDECRKNVLRKKGVVFKGFNDEAKARAFIAINVREQDSHLDDPAACEGISCRRYTGLPHVPKSRSVLDRYHASIYGENNYFRPWDEAEARGIMAHQLEDELYALDEKYNHPRLNAMKRRKFV